MMRKISLQTINEIVKSEPIGRDVYQGALNDGKVAVKKILIKKDWSLYENEIEIMRKINHANIVEFVSYVKDVPYFYLVLEFMNGPTLHQTIHDRTADSWVHSYTHEQASKWLAQAAKALAYLHGWNKPVAHRDVKPMNMLLDADKKILKLCDLGTIKELESFMTRNCGTFAYLPPEVYNGNKYNEKCDVYSMAITIWEVYSRKKPYECQNVQDTLKKISGEDFRPELKDIAECPMHVKDLIERGWKNRPNERPTANEMMQILEK